MASLLTERCYRSTPRGVLTAHAWWLCQCETGACQYHWCSIYRGLERVGSWVPGGSVGRDQLAMAAKVRRHWFNPCRLGSRGHLGANFSLLLYTDLIKKRKPSRYIYIHTHVHSVVPEQCNGSMTSNFLLEKHNTSESHCTKQYSVVQSPQSICGCVVCSLTTYARGCHSHRACSDTFDRRF